MVRNPECFPRYYIYLETDVLPKLAFEFVIRKFNEIEGWAHGKVY